MRYEDASATDSFNADQALAPSTLNANGDVDVILAGQYGPATGNAITGSGTISGIAGADMVGAGASITAIQGAGGTDTSFAGGKLQVAGEHGVLTIDAQGNYSYVRDQGSPNGVSDVFTYTLAGRDGDTDLATLTINIGKTPTVIQANAVKVVPGPDGLVTLPPGVELSDIHVVGRDLVIDMPDGSQMIIVDGAVFVPQLVLGTVEVPSTNLAALLIDSEPTPAAGPPQSSGGNFTVPVAPLDPGVPLGDLIPPTQLSYTPPQVEEVAQAVEEDEIVLITDLTPAVSGGDVTVDEDDLHDGSDTSKESLTVAGTFTLIAPDGVQSLTVGSLNVIVNGSFQAGATLTTPLGNTLTITGYNAATGVVSYSYTLGDNETHANGAGENSLFEDFLVTLTDEDGDVDTDTLSVNIVDDIPTANDDTAGLLEGGAISVTVDVDTNDVPGADGTASRVFASLTGTYGNLVLNGDGTQTYTLNAAGVLAINALAPGATLQDNFSYTLTDGDGDSDPATLVVTLSGTDDPPLITNLTPSANGGEAIVDEDDLADGSDTSKESLTVTGDFTISAPDGIDDLTVGGVNVIVNGVFQAGATGLSPLGNQITFTGYNAATGVVSYSYTLLDNEAHPAGNGENSLFDNMTVTLTDNDGDVDTDALSIQIVDDVPTANDDAFAILEGDADNAITFDVDLNDVPGADGTASRNFTSLTGTYGNLTLNGDGTQTYTLNAVGIAAINALPPGGTLADNFSYTLTDGDGDADPATLVITLTGTDDPPVITGLTPSANGGDAIVDEDDLADGSDTSKESLTVTGDFTISAPDGVDDLTVNGINVIVNGVFQAGATGLSPLGNQITFTGYNAATGVVSYSYTLLDNETHANANGENSLFDNMTVNLTDTDGDLATGTLSVQIVDDVPTANDDAFAILEGDADNAITFDVDLNDVPGADGTASRNFTSLTGTYGNLTLNGDGTQTYTLNAVGILAINALPPGSTLQDNFTYTLTDGDGDSDPATLVITLTGTDDPPVITGLNPSAQGGDAIVDEDDLADGSDTSKESLTVTGDFTISAPDGVNDLTVGGINVIVNGVFQVGATGLSPLGNQITFTGYNAATGVVSYSYTLLDNEAHANANGENSLFDDMTVNLTDTDNDLATGTLSVQIVDDVPTANDDAFSILEGDADNAITFDVDLNDVPGADGTASRTFTSLIGTYGNLTLNGDGTQTYTLNAVGILAINALPPGSTLQDNFTYTLTDGDGDADPATLVITLSGTDDPPVITNLTPSAQGGDAIVDEDDLADGSDTSKESLTVTGDFTISAPDGINDLQVNGIDVFIDGVFQVGASGATPLGNTITFTGYNAATGVVSYSYTLLDNETHANANGENSLFDDMTVNLTDTDNDLATGTLSVQIVDDVPTANDDAFSILEGDADNAITFDVDLNDVPGADGTGSRVFTSLVGTYGNLTINGDGTQTYTLNAVGILAINALPPGATLSDNFTYTLTDTDGDADPATLVITLSGTDDPPVITNLTPSAQGGDAIVDEDDLVPDGSDPTKESTTVTGDFTISAPDGINDLQVNGIDVFINGVFQAGASGATPLGNTITFTGYNAATGVVSYSYTLLDNETHANANGQNSLFDDMTVNLTDTDNDLATGTLSVQIVDDVPTANDDAFTILEGDADNAITFDVDLNDVPGADGTASRTFTSLIGTYGNLTINGDGTQTYTLNATGVLAINALAPGATLTDNFTYTLTDGDGDADPATLVITLSGTDDPPVITNLTPSAQGGDAIVDEDDLVPDGSDPTKESTTVTGDFTISAPDGVNDLQVNGIDVIINGVFQVGATGATPLGNTITFTGYNAATGVVSYSYTLLDNEAHANANGENSLFDDMAVVLTDTDNDIANGTLSVQIVDDVPTANNDTDTIASGTLGPATGNVITDAAAGDAGDGDAGADVPGADGATVSQIASVNVPGNVDTDPGANLAIAGQYGQLTINTDGSYSYARTAGSPGGVNDVFTYTLTDADGDSTTATLTIAIGDATPIIGANAEVGLDDDALLNGNPGGVGDDPDSANVSGTLSGSGGDGALTFTVQLTGAPAGFTYESGGAGIILVKQGTTTVLTVTVNSATGAYTVVQNNPINHAVLANENNQSFTISYTVTDVDGDAAAPAGTLVINVDDDTPSAFNPDPVAALNGATPPVIGGLNLDMGADGLGSAVFDITNGAQATDSFGNLLTTGGQQLYLYGDGTGQVFATTAANGVGGTIAFTVTINGDGTYSFDVNAVVSNGTETSFTDLTSGAAGNVLYRGIGADEPATFIDVLLSGRSDAAGTSGTVNTTSTQIGVDNQGIDANQAVRFDLVENLTTGAATTTGFSFTGRAETNHWEQTVIQVQGSQSATVSVKVNAILSTLAPTSTPDTTPGTLAAGETMATIYRVTVTDYLTAASTTLDISGFAVGSTTAIAYGISVTKNADGSVTFHGIQEGDRYEVDTTTDFNVVVVESPSTNGIAFDLGIFSVGSAATASPIDQNFTVVATDGDGDVVTGTVETTIVSTLTGSAVGTTNADVINGDATANVLAGNAGNDTLNGLAGADFLYGGAGDDTLIGGTENDTLTGGTGADTLSGEAGVDTFVIDGSALLAGQADIITDYAAAEVIDITQVLSVTTATNVVTGGFLRLTTTGLLQVDSDGGGNNWVTIATVNLGVNTTVKYDLSDGTTNTVVLTPVAPPVVLDLNGDGVNFLGHDAGVTYDYNGDGVREATGWAAADDGILVHDANRNGMVDNASEFVFAANDGGSDLEGLSVYDSNGDGQLSAADADFASFAVWRDANSNGVADAGEMHSLTDLGIASISLSSDGIAYSAAGGDVQVAGTGSFTWANGSTGQLADAVFLTESQRNAANTNTAMIAALAAAGVAAAPAAAQSAALASASAVAIAASLIASNGSAIGDTDDMTRPALGNETKEAVGDDAGQLSSTASSSDDYAAGGSLTADNDLSASQPVDLLQGTEAPVSVSVESIVAPMVSMPSAEALIAASLQGGASGGSQSNAIVGSVLVDALEGGGADASVDALLEALPAPGLGGNAAVEALASQPGAAVPAWDMGQIGGFTAPANFTMEAMALHHDAVQPVANG